MPKAAVFSMKLETDLRDAFLAEAEAAHRPASQVVRALMREFIARQREDRERVAFLQRKVDAARASIREGAGRSHDDRRGGIHGTAHPILRRCVRVVWTPQAEKDRVAI